MDEDGNVVWFVESEAFVVACDDTFFPWGRALFADANGGVYAAGDKHLWYVKAGKATQVKPASASEIPTSLPAVTAGHRAWSVLAAHGSTAYAAGYDDGSYAEGPPDFSEE